MFENVVKFDRIHCPGREFPPFTLLILDSCIHLTSSLLAKENYRLWPFLGSRRKGFCCTHWGAILGWYWYVHALEKSGKPKISICRTLLGHLCYGVVSKSNSAASMADGQAYVNSTFSTTELWYYGSSGVVQSFYFLYAEWFMAFVKEVVSKLLFVLLKHIWNVQYCQNSAFFFFVRQDYCKCSKQRNECTMFYLFCK